MFGFLGPNGAGETTTIRVMLGFLRPGGGAARIFGLDCWRESKAIKRDLGYLPGDLRLPSWMNGLAALAIYGAVRGCDLTQPGRQLAGRFDLDLRVKVRDMSRGMRQKLGLILALAHSPRLLVLDEPTNSLDTAHPAIPPSSISVTWPPQGTRSSSPATPWAKWNSYVSASPSCATEALVADESLAALREKAGHEVTIRSAEPARAQGLAPPAFLKLTRQEGAVWQGTLEGPAHRLVDYLAGKAVLELSIGSPDLESLFRRFYQREKGGAR